MPSVAPLPARRLLAALTVLMLLAAGAVGAGRAVANHGQEAGVGVHPGFPVVTDDPTTGSRMTLIEGSSGYSGWLKHSSPTLANLDADPALEIVIGSLDGKVYAWNDDGTRLPGWPRRLDAPSTPTAPINGTPAVGDIDGNGTNDVVIGSDNGWVFAFSNTGQLLPGWPQFTGYNADYPQRCATHVCTGVWASPTLADLDGDGRLEVIVGSFSHKMYVWSHDGRVLPGWPRDVWDGIASTAAVGDLDGDGIPEIVVGSDVANDCSNCAPFGRLTRGGLVHAFRIDGSQLPGWPRPADAFVWSSPALADLDGNGTLEVIVGSGFFPTEGDTRGRYLQVFNRAGQLVWRFRATGVVVGSPAVADVTGDGVPEIAIGDTAGRMYLLNSRGALLWTRDGVTPSAPNGSGAYFFGPVLGDVTGDGVPEVVASDANWRVKAWTPGGALVMDVGTRFSMWNSPAIGDVDADGKNEVVAASANNTGPQGGPIPDRAGRGELWLFDTNGTGGLAWPQFHSRVRPSNAFLAYGSGFRGGVRVAVGDVTAHPGEEIITAPGPGGGPHVRVWSVTDGRARVVAQWFAYGTGFTGGVYVGTANVDGAGRKEVITGAGAGGGPHVRVWSADGGVSLRAQWFAYGATFAGGITVAGADVSPDDSAEEVVTGAGPGGGPHVRVWKVAAGRATVARQWFAYGSSFTGGVFVGAGDLAPSGGAEVVTGAGPGGGPHVKVFSGTGTRLGEWFAYDGRFRGGVRVAAGNVDGSGRDEVITAAGPGGGPHVRCFANASPTAACSFFAFGAGIANGVFPAHGQLPAGRRHVSGLDQGGYPAVRTRG